MALANPVALAVYKVDAIDLKAISMLVYNIDLILIAIAIMAAMTSATTTIILRRLRCHMTCVIFAATALTDVVGVIGDGLINGFPSDPSQLGTWFVHLFIPGAIVGGVFSAITLIAVHFWSRLKSHDVPKQ